MPNKSSKRSGSKGEKLLLRYLPCFFYGCATVLFGLAVLAFAYYKTSSRPQTLYYLVYLFLALAAFLTGSAAFDKLGGRGFLTGLFSAVPLTLALLLVVLITTGFHFGAILFIVVPLMLLFGALGGIAAANRH